MNTKQLKEEFFNKFQFQMSTKDISNLRKAAKELQHWNEMTCGFLNQRIEEGENGECWMVNEQTGSYTPIKNKKKKIIQKIEEAINHYGLFFYIQNDPRVAPLYISDNLLNHYNYKKSLPIF